MVFFAAVNLDEVRFDSAVSRPRDRAKAEPVGSLDALG
jgi:hypothetical protein